MGLLAFLPVCTEDPLAWTRPFPAHPTNAFLAHWHEALGSAVFYFLVQLSSPLVCKACFGKNYTGLNMKTKLNFDIHVVSMVQCVVSIAALLPGWNHLHVKNRVSDPYSSIYGYTAYNGFVSAITMGYFVWDLYVCLKHRKLFGLGFLLHAFAALYVFTCSLIPYCLPWMPAFLLFELSTPFVNINWFGSRLPAGTISDTVMAINGLLLIAIFFLVRIVWGFYAISLVAIDMYQVAQHATYLLPISILGLNILLDVLNVFWFSKMLAIANKKLRGSRATPTEVAAEVAKIEQ